ncbi:hypothetical protein ADK67_05760 [Saccharothrix sp. NRRL B-16348]|nr:hypothetical protein ADK67_05760 [Saccharothrix sp. NRRL B-16348]
MIAGVVAVGSGTGQAPVAGSSNVEPASAREYLTRAADAITATDQPLEPGQYHYVAVHQWASYHVPPSPQEPETDYAYLVESRDETWIPRDITQEWVNRRDRLPGAKWLGGTVPQSEAPLPGPSGSEQGERRGACGSFFGLVPPPPGCGDPDSRHPEFYARLSRDPQVLAQWLRDRTDGARQAGGLKNLPFHFAVQLLRTGLVPADLRASLYRALALLDGVTVADVQVDLDGRVGVAIAVEDVHERRELIVDPANGDFIGERTVAGQQPHFPYLAPGTVTGYSSITTKVVDGIGETS